MDKRSLVFYLSGLAAAGAVVALAASCGEQPRIKCTATHGPFATVFSGGPDCMPKGEQMGVEAYNDTLPDKTNLDPNKGTLGISPLDTNHEIDIHPGMAADPNAKRYSLGPWLTSEPDSNEFCTVGAMVPDTETTLGYIPAVPPGPDGGGAKAAIPSYSAKYHWNNVRFYNTPALPGNQMVADLEVTYQHGLPDGGSLPPCTGTVHVVGLWPAVGCESAETPGTADPTLCSPEPDNSKGRPTGSGINPDLKTHCDTDLFMCVLDSEPR